MSSFFESLLAHCLPKVDFSSGVLLVLPPQNQSSKFSSLQAHKKPIMKYMSDTCSEPGRENKELEHDKLVFLKQLKEVRYQSSLQGSQKPIA